MVLKHEIELIEDSEYRANGGLEDTLRADVRYFVANDILREHKAKGLLAYLDGLKDVLATVKIVQITLAFIPTDRYITTMFDFVNSGRPENLILDIQHDPSLIAGAEITYNGKYGDYTLLSIMNNNEVL